MGIAVVDALGRRVELARPARRVVSLVPSETEAVADLAGVGVLVGRTDFCEEPAGRIEAVASVGGTKKFEVDAVRVLDPDLVLANKEENARPLVEALIAAGLPVHVSFPCTVPEALDYLRSLATLLGVDPVQAPALQAAERAFAEARRAASADRPPLRVFVPIWMDPFMTFDGGAFASDMLEACGAVNVFLDRPRRYPLAADLGRAAPLPPERTRNRDTRYPRVTLEEVIARAPEAILLPDEPHRFTEANAEVFRGLEIPAAQRGAIAFVSGKDLFWYGTRIGAAIPRLRSLLGALSRASA